MENSETIINNVEHYIANNFNDVQKYFPRLGHYLLNLTSQEPPIQPCKLSNYLSAKMFLYLLCFVCDRKLMYIKAHKEFENLITTEKLPGSYLKFNDGYVYSKSYNEATFQMLIEDTAMDVNFAANDIINSANVHILNLTTFRNVVLKILKSQINDCLEDMEDMCSNEYLEMCFMQSLTNVIKVADLMEKDTDLLKN